MTEPVGAIFSPLLVAVAPAAAPFGASPTARNPSKHQSLRDLFAFRRVARRDKVIHVIGGNSCAVRGASFQKQRAEASLIRHAHFNRMRAGHLAMRKRNRDSSCRKIALQPAT